MYLPSRRTSTTCPRNTASAAANVEHGERMAHEHAQATVGVPMMTAATIQNAARACVHVRNRTGVHRSETPDGQGDRYVSRGFPGCRPGDEPPYRHARRASQQDQHITYERHPGQQHRRWAVSCEPHAGTSCFLAVWSCNRDRSSRQPVRRARAQRIARSRHNDRSDPVTGAPDHQHQGDFGGERQNRRRCKTPGEQDEQTQDDLRIMLLPFARRSGGAMILECLQLGPRMTVAISQPRPC